jgi:FeS assembly SUF system protein
VTALKTVYDPEIPADIYEIGLIYRIDIADDRTVKVDMSLTSPNCPSAQELPVMVQDAVSTVPGVGQVDVSVVWDPPWDPSRMSDEARVVLNMFWGIAAVLFRPPKNVAIVEWDRPDDAVAFYKSKAWTDLAPQREKAQKTIRR